MRDSIVVTNIGGTTITILELDGLELAPGESYDLTAVGRYEADGALRALYDLDTSLNRGRQAGLLRVDCGRLPLELEVPV